MLDSYVDALQRGWYPNTMDPSSGPAELERIEADTERFVDLQVDREAAGDPIRLPDGSMANRIPGFRKWVWDGEFCGAVNFRWVPGSNELPAHVLGHVGYTIVEWRRGEGIATWALGELLHDIRAEGLTRIELTTDIDNVASQRVIERNGGSLVGEVALDSRYGSDGSVLLWEIRLGG